jgi:hypothetical protein
VRAGPLQRAAVEEAPVTRCAAKECERALAALLRRPAGVHAAAAAQGAVAGEHDAAAGQPREPADYTGVQRWAGQRILALELGQLQRSL